MEDVEGGVRSYRIQRTTPDGLSYARDIAARYGLNLQEICQNAQGEKLSPEQKLCERQAEKDFTSSDAGIKIKLFRKNAGYIRIDAENAEWIRRSMREEKHHD